jgi:hypothetical protein
MTVIRQPESQMRDKSKADMLIKVLWLWQTLRLLPEIVTLTSSDRSVHHLIIDHDP